MSAHLRAMRQVVDGCNSHVRNLQKQIANDTKLSSSQKLTFVSQLPMVSTSYCTDVNYFIEKGKFDIEICEEELTRKVLDQIPYYNVSSKSIDEIEKIVERRTEYKALMPDGSDYYERHEIYDLASVRDFIYDYTWEIPQETGDDNYYVLKSCMIFKHPDTKKLMIRTENIKFSEVQDHLVGYIKRNLVSFEWDW